MKWVIIKGVRYPSSVISAFAAYNMDNPFLKVRIRNKYHIVPFDDVNKMASQMVYLMDNYPDFVQIGGMVDIQESGDVLGSQGAGRGRIGLGHILYPVLWIGGRDAN